MKRASSLQSGSGSKEGGRKHKLEVDKNEKWARTKKYRTRQSLREISESSTSNNSFDAPSTSTGKNLVFLFKYNFVTSQ